jgi:integration host factor subunit beta
MNKRDLIIKFSDKKGLTYADSKSVIDLFFDDMERSLVKGERVEIRGFGTFRVKEYPGYVGRNPKTGERTKVEPKKLPFFKVAKELRERVDIQ